MRPRCAMIFVLLLSGCDNIGAQFAGKEVSFSGAGVLFNSTQPLNQCNLANLIYYNLPSASYLSAPKCSPASDTETSDLESQIANFGKLSAQSDMETQFRAARNNIQSSLMERSTTLCSQFEQRRRQRSSWTTFGLDTLGAGFGAVGALVTGSASRVFSGLAGATAGTEAAYNRDILSSVTTTVIIPGIEKQRSAITQEIIDRQCLPVARYPLTLAFFDVARLHSACTTDAGVSYAGAAVSKTDSPTLDEVNATLNKIATIRQSLAQANSSPTKTTASQARSTASSGTTHQQSGHSSMGTTTGTTQQQDKQPSSTGGDQTTSSTTARQLLGTRLT